MQLDEKKVRLPHSLIINDRKSIVVTGVTDVDNFDDETITLFSSCGEITIKGEELQVSVLNTDSGDVQASGKIISVTYSDKKEKNQGFFAKVFR